MKLLRRPFIAALALTAAILTAPTPACAHESSASYAKLSVDGAGVRAQWTFNVADFHQKALPDHNQDGWLSEEELQPFLQELFKDVLANYRIEGPDAPTAVQSEGYEIASESVVRLNAVYTFPFQVTRLRIASSLEKLTQPNHRHLVAVRDAQGNAWEAVVDGSRPAVDLDLTRPSMLKTAGRFLVLGVEHIVTGYDHLAFLAGLLLATPTLKALVKVVTSFTAAHSITLALATFNIVALPSRFIESLIALSIAYVAIENFAGRTLAPRWGVTFLFGLVHGFGFSNVLREMELSRSSLATSLFSFNFGVELGQLAFVALVFPVLYLVTSSRWKEQALSTASLAIMALGFYWFVERALAP